MTYRFINNKFTQEFTEYWSIVSQIKMCNFKLKEKQHELYGIKPINYSDCKGTSNKTLVDKIEAIDKLEEKKEALEELREKEYNKLLDKINRIHSEKYRTVLIYKYLERIQYKDIADLMEISEDYVKHLRKKAVELYMTLNNIK